LDDSATHPPKHRSGWSWSSRGYDTSGCRLAAGRDFERDRSDEDRRIDVVRRFWASAIFAATAATAPPTAISPLESQRLSSIASGPSVSNVRMFIAPKRRHSLTRASSGPPSCVTGASPRG
jgi:hypothetical protein